LKHGSTFTVLIDPVDNVEQLKAKIQASQGIDAGQQRIQVLKASDPKDPLQLHAFGDDSSRDLQDGDYIFKLNLGDQDGFLVIAPQPAQAASSAQATSFNVVLEVISASGLIDADLIGKSDPYVDIIVGSASPVEFKTAPVKEKLDPVWNERFSFQVNGENINDIGIVFHVYDHNRILKDKSLGEVSELIMFHVCRF